MSSKHVHKYRRHRYKTGNQVYFCALPDCHSKTLPALALGKRAICWRCEKEFQLNEYSIRLAKPHCDACHKPKDISQLSVESPMKLVIPTINQLDMLRARLTADGEDEEI